MDVIARALAARPPSGVDTLAAWLVATAAARDAGTTPLERALVGGACADRLGFAFAGGYREALRALVPDSPRPLLALCATEDGGAHPRAIATALVVDGDGYRLTGRKRWATLATTAGDLLVVASVGADAAGRNQLRVVRVASDAPGVRLTASSTPFVPEIPHAAVELDGVTVAAAAVLPGDGYDAYLKPFRTVEDVHVHAAVIGYLVGVVRRHRLAPEHADRLVALAAALQAIAAGDLRTPGAHLALAGIIDLCAAELTAIEAAWATAGGDEWPRWQRDRPLLRVAQAARAARRERARADLT